ncbi:hypothetical protein ACE1AT_00925 [Pelatocladus sp. BLCC-F211]
MIKVDRIALVDTSHTIPSRHQLNFWHICGGGNSFKISETLDN